MQLEDSREIKINRESVWSAILDAEMLKNCIPGCQEMTGSVADGFTAIVVQKVGPVKATFKGNVTISDMVIHERLVLSGQGKGGPAGFAKGEAHIKLADTPTGGTLLTYDVQAKVGGKLAQLGSRIIDGFAKKLADQFFERFQSEIEPEKNLTADDEISEDEINEPTKKGWIKRILTG